MARLLTMLVGLQLLYTVGNLGALLQNLNHSAPRQGVRLHSDPEGASVSVVPPGTSTVGFTPGPISLHPAQFPLALRLELAGYLPLQTVVASPQETIQLTPVQWYVPLLYFLRDYPLLPAIVYLLVRALLDYRSRLLENREQQELREAFERGEPRPGLRLGAYELDFKLGTGGMAEVWQATGPDRQPAAVKMVLARRLDDELRARFRREIRIMMELRHPNIVRLDDWGELSGCPFLVMEMVEGPTLLEHLDQAAISVADTIHLGRQLAEALTAVHALSAVHRDLKPANVMLTDRGAKLMDFGVGFMGSKGLTRRGETVGTPGHVAPENLRGERPTNRSDLYSLGVLLYECLADRPPFLAETVGELLQQQLQDDPPVPEGPPELVALVMSLLAREPGDRPESAAVVAERLRAMERGAER